MTVHCAVVRDRYQDSVRLMRINEALRERPGVRDAGIVMATPANVDLLRAGGLWPDDADAAGPNDIAIAVVVDTSTDGRAIIDEAIAMLTAAVATRRTSYASVTAALGDAPVDSIGFVAVPGEHAAAEARRVLESGRSVVIFSDNVPIDEERSLKSFAHDSGLLVMGPDAGTVLLGGLGIGFCNALPLGRIGLVAASGTGAQAVASLIAEAGEGISAIVGLGSHDAGDEIGAISMLDALDALDADPATEVVVLVSKTIGPRTQRVVLDRIAAMRKPVVTLVPGLAEGWVTSAAGASPAFSFADAAARAVSLLTRPGPPAPRPERVGGTRHGAIRGLFSGGTLAQETRAALLGLARGLAPGDAQEISVIDLGDDEFTRGRPHPMIAPSLVAEELRRAIREPSSGAVIFDVVLGFGAHPDPASILAPAIDDALRSGATDVTPPPVVIAIVCGTQDDPQDRNETRASLVRAGCVVFDDPMGAAAFAISAVAEEVAPAARGRWRLPTTETVVAIGPDWFADPIEAQGGNVLHVDWRPPAGGDDELASILGRLM